MKENVIHVHADDELKEYLSHSSLVSPTVESDVHRIYSHVDSHRFVMKNMANTFPSRADENYTL